MSAFSSSLIFFSMTSFISSSLRGHINSPVLKGQMEPSQRYVGYCETKQVLMIPGNARKFWSYGYVMLKEPYPADCALKYLFQTRLNRDDTFVKFGFRVTGTFRGPDILYNSCYNTDYVFLDDLEGNTAMYCGTNATISYVTGANTFEFNFVSQKFSPRARGFYVNIQSVELCGGLVTHSSDGPAGRLTSPMFPGPYPPNVVCTWWFMAKVNTIIRVECHSFLLEGTVLSADGTRRCVDKLSFSYEVRHTKTTEYCGSALNNSAHTIVSKGPTLLVTFQSDSHNQLKGFNCSYEFIKYN